jgi:hypothetical protein
MKILAQIVGVGLLTCLLTCQQNAYPQKLIMNGYTHDLAEGIIESVAITQETLILKVRSGKNTGKITLSPCPALTFLTSRAGLTYRIIAADFPDGPAYTMTVRLHDRTVCFIGINRLLNTAVINGYQLTQGKLIGPKDERRDWVEVVLVENAEKWTAKPGAVVSLHNRWEFILVGATVPKKTEIKERADHTDTGEVAWEEPGFRADFVLFQSSE